MLSFFGRRRFLVLLTLFSSGVFADKVKPVSERRPGVAVAISVQNKCTPIFDTILTTLPGEAGKLCINWARCEYKKQQPNEVDGLSFVGLACFPVDGGCQNLKTCALRAVSPPANVKNRKRKIILDYQNLKSDEPRKGQHFKASIKEVEDDSGRKKLPEESAIVDKFPPPDEPNGPEGVGNYCMMPVQVDPPDPKIPGVVMCAANGVWPDLSCPGIYECIEKRFDSERAKLVTLNKPATSGLALKPTGDLRKHSGGQTTHEEESTVTH